MPRINGMHPHSGRYLDESNRARNIIEHVTGAPKSINTDHAFIHAGIAYKAHLTVGELNRTISATFSLKTPVDKYLHFKNFHLFGVGATLRFRIIRGTAAAPLNIDDPDGGTIGAGDLVGPNNVNDVHGNASGSVFGKTPTYTGGAEGVVWDQVILPGAATNQARSAAMSSVSDNFEYVMKPDMYYVIRITNLATGADATDVGLEMFWYEEDDA